MCLIAFHWAPGTDTPLVLAANRDEFHGRPTRALHWWNWPDGPLAGRDEQAGGTWLAVRRDGRLAAITNYRDPEASSGGRSRGELPLAWLEFQDAPAVFGESLHARRAEYGPFNLVYGDRDHLWIVGTHTAPAAIKPGTHALSNHLLDTPWPKSIRAVRGVRNWRERHDPDFDRLLDLLDDREPAGDDELPDTGVGAEVEKFLSAPFIVSPRYGTRCSTALMLNDRITMAERSFGADGRSIGERIFTWRP